MRCSFCGRSQIPVRPMISGPSVAICFECVQEFVRILLHMEDAPLESFAALDRGPCSFCGNLEGSSAVRVQAAAALVCAPCIALGAEIILDTDANEGTYALQPKARSDFERALKELLHLYPDLAGPGRVLE